MNDLDLPPLARAAGTVRLPGSKSISNRMLLLAALAQGTTEIRDLLDSDDTRVMLAALGKVGRENSRENRGQTTIPAVPPEPTFCGPAGAANKGQSTFFGRFSEF